MPLPLFSECRVVAVWFLLRHLQLLRIGRTYLLRERFHVKHSKISLSFVMPISKISKTVLEKIIYAIREQPQSANGASRVAIAKYLKSELNYDNASALKAALKKAVSSGILVQSGQSFRVKDDKVSQPPPDNNPLIIKDIKEGKGEEAKAGDTVTVKYVGTLDDGHEFDAANNFDFVLGAGDVIKGWDQGVSGMKVGGSRTLTIPSKLGYGKRGCSPDIPPNATLHFEITLKRMK